MIVPECIPQSVRQRLASNTSTVCIFCSFLFLPKKMKERKQHAAASDKINVGLICPYRRSVGLQNHYTGDVQVQEK